MKLQFLNLLFAANVMAASTLITACGSAPTPAPPINDTINAPAKPITNVEPGIYHGVDLSHWNGNAIDEINHEDSLTFAICKGTGGTTYVDPDFKSNMSVVRSKKLISGVYHFYIHGEDPKVQAQHFWNTVKATGYLPDIAPIVDIEQLSLPQGTQVSSTQLQTELLKFINELTTLTKSAPIIYTDLAFANQYLNHPELGRYKLWLADYTKMTQPGIPSAWKNSGYFIWQCSDNYHIESTPTDYDVYKGRISDLVVDYD